MLKDIDFYCKGCKKSFKVTYLLTGIDEKIVMENVFMKCHTCKRVAVLKKYQEGVIRTHQKNGQFFV